MKYFIADINLIYVAKEQEKEKKNNKRRIRATDTPTFSVTVRQNISLIFQRKILYYILIYYILDFSEGFFLRKLSDSIAAVRLISRYIFCKIQI